MEIIAIAYMIVLFAVLTPGVFVILPYHGSKYMVALAHGAIFALIWYFTQKYVKG